MHSPKEQILKLFQSPAPEAAGPWAKYRQEARAAFSLMGFPHPALEAWRHTDLSKALDKSYSFDAPMPPENVDIHSLFQCDIPHLETLLVAQINGWYAHRNRLHTLPGGAIVGSLSAAAKQFPELVDQHFGRYASLQTDGLTALNMALMQDGVFLYLPAGTHLAENMQIINLVDSQLNLFLNNRNLIILGENSSLRLIQCDDSINHGHTFINSVTEIVLGAHASLEHYKLQNKDDNTTLINGMYVHQGAGSRFSTHSISLNGGLIRNQTRVDLAGEYAECETSGLYLMDRNQHVDNQVAINHLTPHCTSRQLYKGVLDDHASGVFNGRIKVARNAQQTNAFQTNKNILLSSKATMDTQPFLEIYADDVKCSHGATVGQLDAEALFYIRSRGISEANARIMLMYAFAAEVIQKIGIDELKLRIDDLVKKRLRGELSHCDQCVLNCSNHEHLPEFKIDLTKI